MTTKVSMTVNGKKVSADVEPRTLLVHYLREHLGLTGTHVGCDTTQCGCCVIHLNGEAVKSCTVFAVQCEDADVVTIEGLAPSEDELHPMQQAFWEHHGLQCGFCTPGMVMMGCDIGRRLPDADEKTIRHELEGNICRCTGYEHIVEAIESGIRNMNAKG